MLDMSKKRVPKISLFCLPFVLFLLVFLPAFFDRGANGNGIAWLTIVGAVSTPLSPLPVPVPGGGDHELRGGEDEDQQQQQQQQQQQEEEEDIPGEGEGRGAGTLRTLSPTSNVGSHAHESALLRRHNTIIVPLVDGMVHALDVQSGKLKWSFSSGPPLVSNIHALPTVLATRDDDNLGEEKEDADSSDEETHNNDEFERLFFPGTDGSLYSYGRKGDKFQRLGINIKKLVEASPSLTSRGLVAIGEKRSMVYMIDSVTGDVIQEFRSTDNGDSNTGKILLPEGLEACLVTEDNLDQLEEAEHDGEDGEMSAPSDKMVCKRRPLFLSRTDWNVTWKSVTTQKVMHNLGFGEVKTLEYPFLKENREEGLPAGGNDLRSRQSLRLVSDMNSNDLWLWDSESGKEQWRVPLEARPIVAFSLSGELISKLEPVGRSYQARETYIGRVGNQVFFLPLPLAQRPLTGMLPPGSTGVIVRDPKIKTTSALGQIGPKHLLPVEVEDEWDPCFPMPENHTDNPNLPAVQVEQNPSRPTQMPSLVNMMLMWYVYFTPVSVIIAMIIGSAIAAFMIFGNLTGMNEKGREQSAKEHRKRPRRRPTNVPKEESQPAAQGDGPTQVQKQQLKVDAMGVRKSRPEDIPDGEEGRYVNRLFVTSKIIGYGSHGTIVVEGKLNKRPVAIKRLLLQFYEKATKEIGALIASDEHPNVVRLYAMEEDSAFVYVALERCNFSLSDLVIGSSGYESTTGSTNCSVGGVPAGSVNSTSVVVKDPHGVYRPVTKTGRDRKELVVQLWDERTWPTPVLVQLMKDIVAGLAHLHSVGIVHRDLKPQNVLVCTMTNRQLRAKLSDMGISKRLEAEQSSFTQSHLTGVGSAGWQAPEQLLHGRQTRSVDMFSLGCVLFFCVSGGCHPFGDKFDRDRNIINGAADLFPITHVPEAVDLIGALLDRDPANRPTSACALMHPLLWSPEERLNFLRHASDRVEGEDREENSQLLMKLEAVGPFALGERPWDEKLSPELLENLGKYRRYNTRSVRDLLRVIRNKLHHHRDLPQELRDLLSPVPEGYELYFRQRFPRLLMEVYKVLFEFCMHEQEFSKYFYNPEGKDTS